MFIWETIMELKKFLMNNEKIVRLFISPTALPYKGKHR